MATSKTSKNARPRCTTSQLIYLVERGRLYNDRLREWSLMCENEHDYRDFYKEYCECEFKLFNACAIVRLTQQQYDLLVSVLRFDIEDTIERGLDALGLPF